MTNQEVINRLIIDRENTLSVRRVEVVMTAGSMGNPCISVGTAPYYEWDNHTDMTYVITYGRYLNCEMVVYPKLIKGDKSFITVKGQKAAIAEVTKILEGIKQKQAA